jgi:AraC family transcriptional regulator of adaptative response/methylated-DNA-[protein]-cysteine methyltransferase
MTSVAIAARTGLDEEACWQATLQKRATSDGLFVVAVTSTKIYCRPSCPSRTPKRQNVRFYAAPDDAETAGFRACKRCRPRDPARFDVTLTKSICRRLDTAANIPTLAELSSEFGVSPFHLQRTFKRVTGLSPRRYAEAKRSERLKSGLRNGNGVAAAVYDAGFGSSSRAYESAPRLLGMTPGRYAQAGVGMRIAYTITTCTFGRMLVAATERGVSAISFADSERPLEDALAAEYPAAEIVRDDRGMRRWLSLVMKSVEEGAEQPQLPLDIRATAFRRRVWDALRAIPRGETRSYSDIARQIGSPKAARAVGNACHVNPIPIIVPCHRVVAEGGGLGGYAYGLRMKKKLLAREGALASSTDE